MVWNRYQGSRCNKNEWTHRLKATGGRFYSNDRIRQHIDRIGQRYYILLKNYWKTGPRENITILTKISQDFPPVAKISASNFEKQKVRGNKRDSRFWKDFFSKKYDQVSKISELPMGKFLETVWTDCVFFTARFAPRACELLCIP